MFWWITTRPLIVSDSFIAAPTWSSVLTGPSVTLSRLYAEYSAPLRSIVGWLRQNTPPNTVSRPRR